MARVLALGRLLRLSLAPSAAADVAAGMVLAAGAWPDGARPFLALCASLCVYHGGMALNDWADREEDARTRPDRPLVSGAVRPGAALVLALVLLLGGPLLAGLFEPRAALLLATVAALAAGYDLAGRGALRGPLLLAACRAGNLALGLLWGGGTDALRGAWLLAPLGYGLYVFLVSRLARLEASSAQELARARPAASLRGAACALLALGALALVFARQRGAASAFLPLPLFLAGAGAFGLFKAARGLSGPALAAPAVERAAGQALRRLLICSATLVLGAGNQAGGLTALAILAGYPLAHGLRRVFPPT